LKSTHFCDHNQAAGLLSSSVILLNVLTILIRKITK
jgi:hypothetical protein